MFITATDLQMRLKASRAVLTVVSILSKPRACTLGNDTGRTDLTVEGRMHMRLSQRIDKHKPIGSS